MDTAQQDHSAFKGVFAELYGPLCSYAFSYLKAPDLCEDIVQEVFTRIWERRRDILHTDGVRFYLFTAVRNTCISYLRQEKKSQALAETGPEQHYDITIPSTRTNDDADFLRLLHEAIDTLPEKCREIFILSRLSKMKYKEIADVLGISVKTVENQIGKALKQVRVFLTEKGITSVR